MSYRASLVSVGAGSAYAANPKIAVAQWSSSPLQPPSAPPPPPPPPPSTAYGSGQATDGPTGASSACRTTSTVVPSPLTQSLSHPTSCLLPCIHACTLCSTACRQRHRPHPRPRFRHPHTHTLIPYACSLMQSGPLLAHLQPSPQRAPGVSDCPPRCHPVGWDFWMLGCSAGALGRDSPHPLRAHLLTLEWGQGQEQEQEQEPKGGRRLPLLAPPLTP